MKTNKLKTYLKFGILLFGILAIFQNCQKEDSFENEFKSQTDYYKTVSLNQLPKLKPVIENLKTFNKLNTNVSARQRTTYLGVENVLVDEIIQITNEDNISNYTFGIDTDFENTGFIENLYLREIEQGYISYIMRYEPSMDWHNNNLYSFHGKDYLNMENFQGDITKYSLEGEVIWSTKQEYITNSSSTSSRLSAEFVTACFISTAPVCGCNTEDHEHDPIGKSCDCIEYVTTEVCQSGWVGGGGSINDDGNDGSDPTSGGGTGDNNNDDCETSGTLVVNQQPISGIGSGCSNNEETGVNTPEKPTVEEDCNTSKEDLKDVFPNTSEVTLEEIADAINEHGKNFGIDTKEKLQHFLSQAGHESTNYAGIEFGVFTENLNYRVNQLGTVDYWQKYFNPITNPTADPNKANPNDYIGNTNSSGITYVNHESFANYVYNDEYRDDSHKLGNINSGDGYKYRGRGIIQLTGRNNYNSFNTFYQANYDSSVNLLNNPDLVASNKEIAVISALWFFKNKVIDNITNGINEDTGVDKVTKLVNGGNKGIDHREELHTNATEHIDCL